MTQATGIACSRIGFAPAARASMALSDEGSLVLDCACIRLW